MGGKRPCRKVPGHVPLGSGRGSAVVVQDHTPGRTCAQTAFARRNSRRPGRAQTRSSAARTSAAASAGISSAAPGRARSGRGSAWRASRSRSLDQTRPTTSLCPSSGYTGMRLSSPIATLNSARSTTACLYSSWASARSSARRTVPTAMLNDHRGAGDRDLSLFPPAAVLALEASRGSEPDERDRDGSNAREPSRGLHVPELRARAATPYRPLHRGRRPGSPECRSGRRRDQREPLATRSARTRRARWSGAADLDRDHST